ncbi:HlyD family efflux transporter periplasmic adaptor subunit [Solimonas sp. K1W22B-7]|uniref:HlyD family efflux transporter periplasmic adaptor subunit n=1 Tax=Solimonas sp. K1W22B-7 TaxID=2303331 RepID=UPI000E32F7ED|nr:HlyD family efflux transporter periplasmic adaptor subunit [Solimonas sp. K1W22B-7]AXQ31286.1 HlyD family efflux transporter periplasmic adaptor subunit [Solimonas sp. K1W22B-7]
MGRVVATLGLLAGAALVHADQGVPPFVAGLEAPQRIGENELRVPKSLQRRLGIRTAMADAAPQRLELLAEVVADPRSSGEVRAAQAGTIEIAERWRLPGEPVVQGELLAWLRPLMPQAEAARRRADIARIDEKLRIARMNFERLRMQADALDNPEATQNNVYYEQADLDWRALQQQRELAAQGLGSRQPIPAAASGTLASAAVREGEVVAAGQTLFEIADPARLQLLAVSHDASLPQRLLGVTLPLPQSVVTLRYRGSEPVAGGTGWKLLFEAQAPPPRALLPGELHRLALSVRPAPASLAQQGCLQLGMAQTGVWLHVAPERFLLRQQASCANWEAGERRVVQGGVLLSQYLH